MTVRKQPPPIGRAADRLAKREVDYGLEDRLLPIDAVMQIAGIGKTMIYRKMRESTFPKSCKSTSSSTRWSEREVREWVAGVLAARAANFSSQPEGRSLLIGGRGSAVSSNALPPRVPAGRKRFIHEGLLCTQAPEYDGVIRAATKLSRHVVHVDDLALKQSGIYFLWRGAAVVYVGQSRTGFNRISQHIYQGYKKFDGVSFIRCPVDQLDTVERRYIDALLPEHNADGITLGMKRRRALAERALVASDEMETIG